MKPTTTLALAVCLSVPAAYPVSAQVDTSRSARNELAVTLGAALTQQRDVTASPLRFDGKGYQLAARYERVAGRLSLAATFDVGSRHLTSAATSSGVQELTEGEVRVAVRRTLRSMQVSSGLAAGVDVARSISITSHHYDDPTERISDFFIRAVTLGPAVSWRRGIVGGSAQAQLSVPFLGFVDHPYSDARIAQARSDARFTTLSKLRGVAAAMTFAT
ncbi:MAG: hypothetical protein ABI877_23020, partial [Gemmatimonadaceae bacterium]